ncbi:hypothetical protein JCM19232_1931 [Vibrio ishigakensis]|uniref:Uncharacterized protein n=1 Tax=Vibrio ishigakensis TaxID=1481914 RepID=A0A0B8PJ60_9VIBR|nr:hypothetical protein JCM19232_1931 [Vibrio ishigakensis]
MTLSGLLMACASTDTELAQKGDWESIGYQDGVKGSMPRSYSKLNELGEAMWVHMSKAILEA